MRPFTALPMATLIAFSRARSWLVRSPLGIASMASPSSSAILARRPQSCASGWPWYNREASASSHSSTAIMSPHIWPRRYRSAMVAPPVPPVLADVAGLELAVMDDFLLGPLLRHLH